MHVPLPMESGRSAIEQRLATLESREEPTNPSLLSSSVTSLRARELDRHLFKVRSDVSCANVTAWRSAFVRSNRNATMDEAVRALSAASLPQMRRKRTQSAAFSDSLEASSLLSLPTEERVMRRRLMSDFEQHLDSVHPVVDSGGYLEAEGADTSRECQICFDRFRAEDTLHCLHSNLHVVCCKCFYAYAKTNASKHSLETLPCPQCQQTYDRLVLQINLPVDLFERMEMHQASVDWRVALANNVAATLYCECGLVGVIERDSIGDNTVSCAQCDSSYCIKCGNYAHPGIVCPLPRETIRWLERHRGKFCPNCGEGIEKNGGCSHMTCRSCRHQFCWVCLGNWPRCDCRKNN